MQNTNCTCCAAPRSEDPCATCEGDPLIQYRNTVAPQPHVSVAESLLAYWERPTIRSQRFALHALATAYRAGLLVLA